MTRSLSCLLVSLICPLSLAGDAPCSPADLAAPSGVLDFNDVVAFLTAFSAGEPAADLATPVGVYDFNDVVAYLSLFSEGCPAPEEIVLRDSIGPDSSMTDFNGFINMSHFNYGSGAWNVSAIAIQPTEESTLQQLQAVVHPSQDGAEWEVVDWELRVWDSFAAFESDPNCQLPTSQKFTLDGPDVAPTPFGTTFFIFFELPTYKLSFDLSPFMLRAGPESPIVLSLVTLTGGTGQPGGVFYFAESDEPLPNTDRYCGSTLGCMFTSDFPDVQDSGRLAVRVTACTVDDPEEINLRTDANGNWASCWDTQDDACTDMRDDIPANSQGSTYGMSAARISLKSTSTITRMSGTGYALSDDYVSFDGQIRMRIYPHPPTAFGIDPQNLAAALHADDDVIYLSGANPPFYGGESGTTGADFRYLEFDFEDVTLPPGDYWVCLYRAVGNGLFCAHATIDVGSDIFTSNAFQPEYRSLRDDFGFTPGSLAVDVFGIPQTD